MSSSSSESRPRLTILYHYFHPDDVVSARHFSDLAEGLAGLGWQVEAEPCNRGCRDETKIYRAKQEWNGVSIRRVWRPRFRQASGLGRILNAGWMIAAWSRLALRRGRRQSNIVLMGTDPILSALTAGLLKTLRPRMRTVHWVFDLYPEAAVADGLLSADGSLVSTLGRWMAWAYRSCDLIVDIGPCMRQRLAVYGSRARASTLPPWALSEPSEPPAANPLVRQKLFGDARLALMYSGNFGRAHEYREFLELGRKLRGTGIELGFAVRGNRVEELKAAVTADDRNVRFLPFASEAELTEHLAAADVHLASLRQEWTGLVVPSKFFGSLAAGRPVLFAGDPASGIAAWIKEEQVGWTLEPATLEATAESLRRLADAPNELQQLQRRCHEVYQRRFSKQRMIAEFDRELRQLLK